MTIQNRLLERQLYLGHLASPCPYLDDRESNLLFLDGKTVGSHYRSLLDAGYRRHGKLVYRPDCAGCSECRVIRVPLAEFRMSKSQRRVWNRGQHVFEVRVVSPSYSDEKAAMYEAYLRHQHDKSEGIIDEDRYSDFFVDSFLGEGTREIQLWAEGRLAGVGILDMVADVLSSVYFFFDPKWAPFSPGTFSALAEIDWARSQNLAYYYLGYYIEDCRTMVYKASYRPCEISTLSGTWERRD
jgi:leucyl-tRNA---protein transferase